MECFAVAGSFLIPMSRTHILTVALEDYFHAPAFRGVIGEKTWGRFETRYEKSTLSALALLAAAKSRATFFVGPWLAQKCPEVLREIVRQGHEIALSGDRGPGFRTLAREDFRDLVRRGRAAVEESCGHEVLGYRRSDVLLRSKHLCGLEVLAEEGFLYDSSVSPMGLPFPGQPWRRFVHKQQFGGSSIWEFPLSSQSVGGLMIPFAGGNYFRQYPESVVRWFIQHWDQSHDQPLVLYFRVWDLDPAQPRIHTGSMVRDLRHYRNGDQGVRIINDLFETYRFDSIAGSLDRAQQLSAPSSVTAPRAVLVSSKASAMDKLKPVSVIIPCYNEEASIPYLSRSLDELKSELQPDYDVQFIFVDDGSSDTTWQTLQDVFGARADSLILRHERNRGVAAAVFTGLQNSREIACSMDCDCSYDPRELKPMLGLLTADVDLVTASPYHPLGRVSNVPSWRIGLSRGASLLYQIVTGCRIYTFTSCLRVYRRAAAVETEPENPGFLGVAELAGRFALSGRTIVEHPATLELRLFGVSKMKIIRTIGGHLNLLAGLAWSRLTRRAGAAPPSTSRMNAAENIPIATEIKTSGLNS
jgi:polysaccharide deacetylase family protein (PEP-CTERM system associated)